MSAGLYFRDVVNLLNPNHVQVRMPNWMLEREERRALARNRAEVCTPSWIVKRMTDALDTDALDRKLKAIHAEDRQDWQKQAMQALMSVYAYELDESLLILGRFNLLMDVVEHCPYPVDCGDLVIYSMIIAVNTFQMDGLTGLDAEGVPALVHDWKSGEDIEFRKLGKDGENESVHGIRSFTAADLLRVLFDVHNEQKAA